MLQQESIFKDLLVIELASVLAGPAVGMFFAELGARVIKFENKNTGGDVTRKWKVPGEDAQSEYSAYYQHVNYGKEVLLLDFKQEKDRAIAYGWLQKADLIITNYPEKKAKKLGMDLDLLRQLNPSAIIAHLSAFGIENDRPAFDVVLQAEAGFLFMTGHPDGPPAKMPVALIDILAAHHLKEGILIALLHRFKTGKGTLVRSSLLEAAVASLANQATNWLVAKHIPQRMGAQHPNIAPYGDLFLCKNEKPMVLAIGSDRHFEKLCNVLSHEDLAQNPKFSTNVQRVQNRQELQDLLSTKIQDWERNKLLKALEKQEVPAGAIRRMNEVFDIPMASEMVRNYILPSGEQGTCIRSIAFELVG